MTLQNEGKKGIINKTFCGSLRSRTMKKLSETQSENRKYRILFVLIMIAGIFARVYRFGTVPGDINQDEAFAGYEAYSILKYGMDTAGYKYPVYLTAWGSGMNALESYLMIPFIALFGLKVWVIRLPQLIAAIASLPAVYFLIKRLMDRKAAILSMLMLAICPWHIILSRWGLESNLTPAFLLFGLLFFAKGLDKPKFLLLSAFMYGLSLYCYATYWIYAPFIVLLECIYCLALKKLKFDRYLLASAVILAVLALPLVLFLLINYGLLDEIKTPFISIPKILYMRNGELSLDEKAKKLELLRNIFVFQTDGNIWNSPTKYGLFYYSSMPFALAGLVYCIRRLIQRSKEKMFCPEALLLIQPLVSLPQCILIKANATKINILFLPLVIFTALGIYCLEKITFRKFAAIIAALYCVLFAGFEHYYFTDYVKESDVYFSRGLEQAFEYADSRGEHVYFEEGTFYPKILFYAKTPVEKFRDTVEYEFYPASYLTAYGFDKYSLWADPHHPEDNAAYVLSAGSDSGILEESGFDKTPFGRYIVYTKNENR